ncbi:MAG: hypothetical protein DRO14_00405 [Thermoprotei archaeon]|nr:MAG: hypothetical protein DRO14_00030 [Thermoprotei archaeon]RLG78610.1 MAG: hypothetical protein DRO14_00405 [Thermoprotei archaeon]
MKFLKVVGRWLYVPSEIRERFKDMKADYFRIEYRKGNFVLIPFIKVVPAKVYHPGNRYYVYDDRLRIEPVDIKEIDIDKITQRRIRSLGGSLLYVEIEKHKNYVVWTYKGVAFLITRNAFYYDSSSGLDYNQARNRAYIIASILKKEGLAR